MNANFTASDWNKASGVDSNVAKTFEFKNRTMNQLE